MIVEILTITAGALVDTVATECCKIATRKAIKPKIEKEVLKLGDNPTQEQIEKATKKAARKCMVKRVLINSAVSATTIVGTSVVATKIISADIPEATNEVQTEEAATTSENQ